MILPQEKVTAGIRVLWNDQGQYQYLKSHCRYGEAKVLRSLPAMSTGKFVSLLGNEEVSPGSWAAAWQVVVVVHTASSVHHN